MDDDHEDFPDPEELISERVFLQQNAEEIEKSIREKAKLFRICFQALRSEGFDDEQALELIVERGPILE